MIEFIGRFHPLLVHLPIGFLVLLGVFELLALRSKKQHLTESSRVVLVLTFPVTLVSIICGWLLANNGEYEGPNLFWHRWLGTGLGLAALVLLALHWAGMFRLYRWALTGTLGLLVVASHFGGTLTHGSDFLAWPGKKASKPIGDLATQPVHAAAIQPILNKYCVSCHGPDKAKGGLKLNTVADLLKGGDSGSVIEPSGATQSLLGKRLALPMDDEDHMPPDGKPQPSADQLAILNWWLDAGAPTDKTIQDLKPTPEMLRTIESILGAPASSPVSDK
jgi:uncharacterized membrane protein/mono/diheme cytochrome c family protein